MKKYIHKVSICIPAYEKPQQLKRCLNSIAWQVFDDYEIIITDDSRNQSIKAVISLFKKTFGSKLLYIKNDRSLGAPRNWNKAISFARGEYVKIIHHDDWLSDRNSLLNFVNAMDNSPDSILGFAVSLNTNEQMNIISKNYIDKDKLKSIENNPYCLFYNNYIGAPSATIYRNINKIIFDANLKWLVDVDFYIRLLEENGKKILFIPDSSVNISLEHNRVTSLCVSSPDIIWEENLYMANKLKKHLCFYNVIVHLNNILISCNFRMDKFFDFGLWKRYGLKVFLFLILFKFMSRIKLILNQEFFSRPPNSGMTIVKIQGGLGNQMFQYAFGRALSLKKTEPLKLDISSYPDHNRREYYLNYYNISAEFATQEESCFAQYQYQPLYWRILCRILKKTCPPQIALSCLVQNGSEYFDKIYDKRYIYYNGYWQNEKYFNEIRDELLRTFTLKNTFSDRTVTYLKQISENNSIAIHVRRTDYANNPTTNKFHGLLDIKYYEQAIDFINARVKKNDIFIFSDDIDWCKNNFIRYNPVYIKNTAPHEDIFLMSKCQHNIIANSSFSWWGAWLNENKEKIVVAPEQWFADDLANEQAYKDGLIPDNWVRL
ncbi:MAG: alpha-1,2-fucosyltransferase [Victivallaceae bacterium]|nr:alpha-1,2-fucosyltransferase [Victivallaceae bacterium]